MSVMTVSNVTTRSLLLNGSPNYIEADENGDGFFESVMLPGEWAGEFEVFTRQADGTLEPLAEPEYSSMKAEVIEASEALGELLEDAEKKFEPDAAPEPPSAAPVQDGSETMNPKPKSEAPADSGGR